MPESQPGQLPFPEKGGPVPENTGMTLRDRFAGQALRGLLAGRGDRVLAEPEVYAEVAYRMADAMLARRKFY